MAKISDLSAVTSLLSTDEMVLARAGASNKIDGLLMPGFEVDYVEKTSDTTISATSSATANTIVTGNAVTYDGTMKVMIEFYSCAVQTGNALGDRVTVGIFEDGTSIGNVVLLQTPAANFFITAVTVTRRRTPSSGSHTYSARAYKESGDTDGTVFGGSGGADTRVPAFIRVVTV